MLWVGIVDRGVKGRVGEGSFLGIRVCFIFLFEESVDDKDLGVKCLFGSWGWGW